MKRITFSKDALRTLSRMPVNTARLIRAKIDQFAADSASLANNVKALKGVEGVYRLRIGDWRVVFNEDGRVISVVRIALDRPQGAARAISARGSEAAEEPDQVVDRRPIARPGCGPALSPDLPAETVSVHEGIKLPAVAPFVEQHRRLAVVCPGCRTRVAAPRRASAASTPFGPSPQRRPRP